MKYLIIFTILQLSLFIACCQSLNFENCNCDKDISKNIAFVERVMKHPDKLSEILTSDSSYLSDYFLKRHFEKSIENNNTQFYNEFLDFFNNHFRMGYVVSECICKYQGKDNLLNRSKSDIVSNIYIRSLKSDRIYQIIFRFEFDDKNNSWKFLTITLDYNKVRFVEPAEG